jgi:LysM repeat protein
MPFPKTLLAMLLSAFLISSCAPSDATQVVFPTYDPFVPLGGESPQGSALPHVDPALPTATRPPTPTRVPLMISPFAVGIESQLLNTPTPDAARTLPTPRVKEDEYVVQAGDTLGIIAQQYGVSVQALMQANNLSDPNLLDVGMVLKIPAAQPASAGTSFKIIPDSELVYGPAGVYFDVDDFIESQNGYLAGYAQDVNGVVRSGREIVATVAQNYSVNPRLLLALLEYQSGWVTNPTPFNTSYPMGMADGNREGLYRQLTWAANALNRGYYLWRVNALSTWILNDGTALDINPTINAGTAAVQYFFSQLGDRTTWEKDTSATGLFLTYYVFFGNPFGYAIEPLVPPGLSQPVMLLPFQAGEAWHFTGGPHGGWDSGSAWAALDFAPADNTSGHCETSPMWTTAAADGLIVRADDGAVIQDLDNDGYEQTGWVVLYMHIAEQDRVQAGEYLFAGERVGHPSCEGGFSNATHMHIARKYNGEWIPADGSLPFNLSGWVSSGTGVEYDGFLSRGSTRVEAWDGANEFNLVAR